MMWSFVSRFAGLATAGWVAYAQPFEPWSNFGFILALVATILAQEFNLMPSKAGH